METKNIHLERGRYRREEGMVIVDVAVKNSRQLFNERDPAPFRERDLDSDFVAYVQSSVQEFPLTAAMKLRITLQAESDRELNQADLCAAIRNYFRYESNLVRATTRKRLRAGWYFLLIGIVVLFVCLGVAQLISSMQSNSNVWSIIREGVVIVGWVAMWRPIKVFLYDWWPLWEQRRHLDKIAAMPIEVVFAKPN